MHRGPDVRLGRNEFAFAYADQQTHRQDHKGHDADRAQILAQDQRAQQTATARHRCKDG